MSLVLSSDGPGTNVTVQDGEQGLPPSPRGTVGILGTFPSGPAGVAVLAIGAAYARMVSGDPSDDFEGSLVMSDVFHFSSPPALVTRITSGTELQSQVFLWDRNPDRSWVPSGLGNADRAPMATLKAQNGGRWAGAKTVLVGILNSVANDLTTNTVDIGAATGQFTYADGSWPVDRWKGALFTLQGDPTVYEVESNTINGVFTIKGEFSTAALAATGSGAINGHFRLVLHSTQELTVTIGTDGATGSRFNLAAHRKFDANSGWELVTSYNDLGLHPTDNRPWVSTIVKGETQGSSPRYQIEVAPAYTGPTIETKLPANFCEVPTVITGPTIEFQWYRWHRGATNTGNPVLTSIAPVDANSIEPHIITIVFSAATTFGVLLQWPDGTTQSGIGTGSTGVEFVPTHPQLTRFTINVGGTGAVSGDTITVRVNPIPHDLLRRDPFVYPVALSTDGNSNQRLPIAAHTFKSISIRSDLSIADYGVAVGAPPSVTTGDLSSSTFDIGDTIIIGANGASNITLTASSNNTGAAQIRTHLDALDTANIFTFTVNAADNTITITVNNSWGSRSSLTIGSGTGNSELGLSPGTTLGTDAKPFRVEAKWPMWGGYDGTTPLPARYIQALDLQNGAFNRFLDTNLGLVRFVAVGQSDYGVKSAGRTYAEKHGWKYVPEFAASLESNALPGEAALADMIDNERESDFVDHIFPSRGTFFNVARSKEVERSLVGCYLGLKAKMAIDGVDGERGLHIAIANNNVQGAISPRCIGLSAELDRWKPSKKLLDDNGIVMVLWEGNDVFFWGNRMYSKGRTAAGARYTITERDVYYHVARDLFVTTRPFIYKSISQSRIGDILVAVRQKMKVYHQDGWVSDLDGPGFEQGVQISAPKDMNTRATLLAGNVSVRVAFVPKPSLERLNFIISPNQLSST